jgi:hypothetical protein
MLRDQARSASRHHFGVVTEQLARLSVGNVPVEFYAARQASFAQEIARR